MERLLSEGELAFITEMLKYTTCNRVSLQMLKKINVVEMNDGGMGSLKFIYNNEDNSFGEVLIGVRFKDVDGVEVIASIYLDRDEKIFELDVWKTDFSPLCHKLDTSYKIISTVD